MTLARYAALAVAILAVAVSAVHRAFVVNPLREPAARVDGKRFVVTGATVGGIGFEIAEKLCGLGASEVVLPLRDEAKARAARAELARRRPGCVATAVPGFDLASLASVRAFARSLRGPVHGLVNNAGLNKLEFEPTKDGIETTFQVNHLGPTLLAVELLPRLEEARKSSGAESRVVFVSSNMHYLGNAELGAPYDVASKGLDPSSRRMDRYSDTKLLNVLAAKAFDAKFKSRGVRANAAHPGFIISLLDQHLPPGVRDVVVTLRTLVARPTPDGAISPVAVVTDPRLEGVGGRYFEDRCIDDLCNATCVMCDRDAPPGVRVSSVVTPALVEYAWGVAAKLTGFNEVTGAVA